MHAMHYQLDGLVLFQPTLHADARGTFFESYNARLFQEATGHNGTFTQDNHSLSKAGVVRGLHYQIAPHAQGKLVRVVAGRIFDVGVDLRETSHTFGKWAGIELSAQNQLQLWLPPGFAHGFLALEDNSEVLYKTTDFWHRESERTIRWDDADINIDWPLADLRVLVSEKDAAAPKLSETQKMAVTPSRA